MWLITINSNIVKPEQKEKLVQYQLKAKDVLANFFLRGNEQAPTTNIITQKEVVELLSFKESFEKIINASGFIEISTAAKVINNVHITGRTRLFQYMRKIGLLDKHNKPYQQYVNNGFFTVNVFVINSEVIYIPKISTRGIAYIIRTLNNDLAMVA